MRVVVHGFHEHPSLPHHYDELDVGTVRTSNPFEATYGVVVREVLLHRVAKICRLDGNEVQGCKFFARFRLTARRYWDLHPQLCPPANRCW